MRLLTKAWFAPLALAVFVLGAPLAAAQSTWQGTGTFTFSSTPSVGGPCTGDGTAEIYLDGGDGSMTGTLTVTMGSMTTPCYGYFPSPGSTITTGLFLSGSGSGFSGTNEWGDSVSGSFSGGSLHVTMTITSEPTPGAQCVAYCDTVFEFAFTGSGDLFAGFGGLGPLDPSSPMFVPTFLSLAFSFAGIAMANARPPPVPASAGRPSWWKPLRPGVPASMTAHLVSLRDVPLGAIRQSHPQIPMEQGKATDIGQKMHCPRCTAPLGYTVAGWFCLNPACARPAGPETLFPQVGQGYGQPPMAPPPPPP